MTRLMLIVVGINSLLAAQQPASSGQAGASACTGCHPVQSAKARTTGMTHALKTAAASEILRANPLLTFSEGRYKTSIERSGSDSTLSVTDGNETFRAPIQWAFGLGTAGQTYVFEHAGELYETRVSYYKAVNGLDLTMGAQLSGPATLIEAAGRRMDKADIRECFGCHSTAGVEPRGVNWASLVPGVTCEKCHRGSAGHAAARAGGNTKAAALQKLTRLTSEETNELCGSCHRTWAQVVQMKIRGPLNVRFQPYRLTNSKCFDTEDRRIACTACHDPHSELQRDAAAYDTKCLACHSRSGEVVSKASASKTSSPKSLKVCHTANAQCTTCHMPKIDLAGAHSSFTDHQIRVDKPGDPYPN